MTHIHDPQIERLPLTARPVLFDACDECEARAKDPLGALLLMDEDHLAAAWNRMLAVEMNTGPYKPSHVYLSRTEGKVGQALYYLYLLLQRNPHLLTADDRG